VSTERLFRIAFWGLLGLTVLMRVWFACRVRRAGERLLPDRTSIQREGWWVFAIRVGASLLLVALVMLPFYHLSPRRLTIRLPNWLRWAGFASGMASLGFWTWTHMALGRLWSAELRLRADHRLVTSGPYSLIRHPMYTAILVWAVSLGFVIANWIPLAVAVGAAVIFVMRIPKEEHMMLEQFGDEYRDYMKRTGRFFPRWQTSPREAKKNNAG
jgi:protein-S-isoprenylcysteine O-methyltransferase Ste14